MLGNKDLEGFLRPFAGRVDHLYAVPLKTTNAFLSPEDIVHRARAMGFDCEVAADPFEAVTAIAHRTARESAQDTKIAHRPVRESEPNPATDPLNTGAASALRPHRILICGSLYLAGEVLGATTEIPH